MRIYTRAGDTGDTGLYGGQRVRKDDVRVETYGTVDEANALLGIAIADLGGGEELREIVTGLQNDLFVVGGDLATPLDRDTPDKTAVPRMTAFHVEQLEAQIDRLEPGLPPLRNFILPGGSLIAANLHLARAVVRRAERRLVTLMDVEPDSVNPETLRYLNRLADLLFVLARATNRRAGVPDVPWSR